MKKDFYIIIAVAVLSARAQAVPDSFVAYSLRQAAAHVAAGDHCAELEDLAGITRVAGFVFDSTNNDVIVIGKRTASCPRLTLDDLVVGLQTRLVHDQWPLVSIDPAADTDKTLLQTVRIVGVGSSKWGQDFVSADIWLKKQALKLLGGESPVRSYRDYFEDGLRGEAARQGERVLDIHWTPATDGRKTVDQHRQQRMQVVNSSWSRFWFYPINFRPAVCEDVFCIKELELGLRVDEFQPDGVTNHEMSPAQLYAAEFTRSMDAVSKLAPVARLKGLYDLTALSEGIHRMGCDSAAAGLLEHYHVHAVNTPTNYPLVQLIGEVVRSDGLPRLVRLAGGIDFQIDIQFMNHGDVSPLRNIVLASRPAPCTLSWEPPLDNWDMPNSGDLASAGNQPDTVTTRRPAGCWVGSDSILFQPPNGAITGGRIFDSFPAIRPVPPLSGVSFMMKVDNRSFHAEADNLSPQVIGDRPSAGSLFWHSR